jgi:hypothetical protein
MATLRGKTPNGSSFASSDPCYQYITTRTEEYEAPERRGSDKMVTKTRTLWECNFCDEEFTGVLLGRMRGHFSGNKLFATAAGICACPEVDPQVAEAFHTICSEKADAAARSRRLHFFALFFSSTSRARDLVCPQCTRK